MFYYIILHHCTMSIITPTHTFPPQKSFLTRVSKNSSYSTRHFHSHAGVPATPTPLCPATRRDKQEASERLCWLDGRWCTAGSATCLSGSLYFEAAAPETSRPRSNKQRAGKYADVCSRTWVGFSPQQQQRRRRWSPCGSASCGSAGCSRRDAFAVPSTRTSPSAVHVGALAGPIRAVRGSEWFLGFSGAARRVFFFFAGRCFFPAESYWERRNLIPGNLGYWKQVKSLQPHRRCVSLFPSPRKMSFSRFDAHTPLLAMKRRAFILLQPEI